MLEPYLRTALATILEEKDIEESQLVHHEYTNLSLGICMSCGFIEYVGIDETDGECENCRRYEMTSGYLLAQCPH